MTSTYLLRDIDRTLWRQVKARAKAEGRPLRWLILRLLSLYAGGQVDVNTTPTVKGAQ